MDTLNEKIEGLVKKAEKSKMPYSILKKVYDRGMAAWKTGHRPGTTPQQWAFARVNSFITKSSGTWGKADADLAKQVRGEEVEKRTTAKEMLGQVKEINQLNEFEHIISFTGKDGLPAYYLDKIFKGSGPAHVAVRKLEKKTGSKRYSVMKYPPAKGKSEFDKKKRDFKKEDISEKLPKDADAGDYLQQVRERELTDKELKRREEIAKDLPDAEFKKRYGNAWMGVKMATATKMAKKEEVKEEENLNEFQFRIMYKKGNEEYLLDKIFKGSQGAMKIVRKLGHDFDVVTHRSVKDKKMKVRKLKQGPKVEDNIQEENLQELINYSRQLKDPKKEVMVMHKKDGRAFVVDRKDEPKWLKQGYIRVEQREENLQEMEVKYIHTRDPQGFMNTYSGTSASKGLSMLSKDSPRKGEYLIRGDKKNHDVFQKMLKGRGIRPEIKIMKEENLQEAIDKKTAEWIIKNSTHQRFGGYQFEYYLSREMISKMKELKMKPPRGVSPTRGGSLSELIKAATGKDVYLDGPNVVMGNKTIGKWKSGSMQSMTIGEILKMAGLLRQFQREENNQGDKMNEDNIIEQFVHTVRFEKEGMRFAVPFYDKQKAMDGKKVLQKSQGVSNLSVTKDLLKPGVKLSAEGKILPESKMGEYFLDMQMDAQEMSERDFIKKYRGEMGMSPQELKRMYKEFNEEVDNSLMAQATRVISQTSIKEKIDPADMDNIATADDRKAADKNIIIQLRRAQDMQGKADVTFKDKPNKKEKIDIKVINKALDMFDKMRPNDKAKMQTTIGKSYRDLLKTVQRGRIWNTLTQKKTVLKKQSLRL